MAFELGETAEAVSVEIMVIALTRLKPGVVRMILRGEFTV